MRQLYSNRLDLDQRPMSMAMSFSQHVGGKNPRPLKRLLAIRGRGPTHAALHIRQTRTPRARSYMAAFRTNRQVLGSNRTNLIQFRGMPPDINKFLPPHIAT